MKIKTALDTVATTSSSLSSLISGTFRIKLFFIVGFTALMLGFGVGLTTGIYWGYKKWTKKVDTLIEQSKKYRETIIDKIKHY